MKRGLKHIQDGCYEIDKVLQHLKDLTLECMSIHESLQQMHEMLNLASKGI